MAQLVLAIDIGGTKTAIGLVDPETGKILKQEKFPTEKSSPEAFIEKIFDASAAYIKEASAIGIAAAGLTDPENGTLIKAPNLPKSFENLQLAATLEARTKLPTTIDNDAHCFTLAEAHFGQGKGKNLVLGVTLGTGIGGGITFQGRLLTGALNAAGELGHITLAHNTIPTTNPKSLPRCSCGKTGHLESYASGSAMTRLYKEATGESANAIEIENIALGKTGTKGQQKIAQKINEKTAEALAAGLASAIHILNPDCVILGGGLLRMKMYTEATKKALNQHLAFNQLSKTPILDATLGDNAQLIGAAMLTL